MSVLKLRVSFADKYCRVSYFVGTYVSLNRVYFSLLFSVYVRNEKKPQKEVKLIVIMSKFYI